MAERERIGRRVAVVAGLRTPFVKNGGKFSRLSGLDLGKMVVGELLQRTELSPREIDQVVFGQVVASPQAPNIAREIVLGIGLPRSIEAFSVSRACATSLQAMTSAAEHIALGLADVAVVGGSDTASDVPVTLSKRLTNALVVAQKQRTLTGKLRAFSGLKPRDLLPVPPALTELSTGLSMGESAEVMAKENHIARDAQDAFAHRSHERAAKAWADGTFAKQVMHALIPPKFDRAVTEDDVVRKGGTLESYAKLKPVFDGVNGTITAGNSCPLTDGAAALLVMSEQKAKALGYPPLGFIRSYAYAALDPAWQMLMGPSFSTPVALDRAGLTLKDLDLVDMHEAFAAQVLSNTQAFESDRFAQDRLGRAAKIGEIDWEAFNVHGGSISIGHPFAATGARMITQSLHELQRRGGQFSLVTLCAAGGLGAAVVLERA